MVNIDMFAPVCMQAEQGEENGEMYQLHKLSEWLQKQLNNVICVTDKVVGWLWLESIQIFEQCYWLPDGEQKKKNQKNVHAGSSEQVHELWYFSCGMLNGRR